MRPRLKALWIAVLVSVSSVLIAQQVQSMQQTQLADAKTAKFADDLLAKMSVEEKIGQLEQAPGQYTPKQQADDLTRQGKLGSFLFFTDPVRINELQRIAVTESPHHIPLLFGYDVIHGFRTIGPIPLALAASWDPSLAEHAQAMAAREARAAGVDWAFSPMVDIARDPRWGRIMESAGEDPYLGEQMAAAQVRGFQGPSIGSPDHILACVKHFGGYGAPEGGRDYDSVDLSDEQLHNVYLRPYHAAVQAGVATVMSAYVDLNGVPATGNRWLMHDVLREQWGFKGFVVSDWDAVKSLTVHGFSSDAADAAYRAFDAGINMEMTSDTYREQLPALIRSGRISAVQLDAAVRPILELKYRLGLFSNPYVDMDRYHAEELSAAQRLSARKAAEQTAVLLRDEQGLLPLSKAYKTIAVVGPLADAPRDTMGSWALHGDPADTVTIVQGLRAKLPNVHVLATRGVEIVRGQPSIFDKQAPEPAPTLLTDQARNDEFAHAIDLVRAGRSAEHERRARQPRHADSSRRAAEAVGGRGGDRQARGPCADGRPTAGHHLGRAARQRNSRCVVPRHGGRQCRGRPVDRRRCAGGQAAHHLAALRGTGADLLQQQPYADSRRDRHSLLGRVFGSVVSLRLWTQLYKVCLEQSAG
jgi:beta-glucosidase